MLKVYDLCYGGGTLRPSSWEIWCFLQTYLSGVNKCCIFVCLIAGKQCSTWILWFFNKGWLNAGCLFISKQSMISPYFVWNKKEREDRLNTTTSKVRETRIRYHQIHTLIVLLTDDPMMSFDSSAEYISERTFSPSTLLCLMMRKLMLRKNTKA